MRYDLGIWTYGCEHEFADWDRSITLPEGWYSDPEDNTMVNSNGIAVDPRGEMYGFGGEVNTPPTYHPSEQVLFLNQFLQMCPDAQVNYRSNLHVHVRLPGLEEDLPGLKSLQTYLRKWMPTLLPIIDPIPPASLLEDMTPQQYAGALARAKRRKRSHHTIVPEARYVKQILAKSPSEFFAAEAPRGDNDAVLFRLQSRAAVNLRKLIEPPHTIEFRHFPGTLDGDELLTCIEWCRDFLLAWLAEDNPIMLYRQRYANRLWPTFRPYNHAMELRYRMTNRTDCRVGAIRRNIEEILAEDPNS